MKHDRHPDPDKARRYFEAKLAFTTGPAELQSMLKERDDVVVVDVRAAQDYAEGHVPGAVSLPEDEWEAAGELDRRKLTVVYCYSQVCHLAARAAVRIADHGVPVMELEGGFAAWRADGLPVEAGDGADAGRHREATEPMKGTRLDAAQAEFAPTYRAGDDRGGGIRPFSDLIGSARESELHLSTSASLR